MKAVTFVNPNLTIQLFRLFVSVILAQYKSLVLAIALKAKTTRPTKMLRDSQEFGQPHPHETHWGGYFLRTNFSLRTKIRIFERRFEFEDCICFNRNSIKSNRIQAAGENCRKSEATAARAPD